MLYSKAEQKDWEEFEESCLLTGINKHSFHGMDDVFDEFEKYKVWREKEKKEVKKYETT